jgi:hypothetical protein
MASSLISFVIQSGSLGFRSATQHEASARGFGSGGSTTGFGFRFPVVFQRCQPWSAV